MEIGACFYSDGWKAFTSLKDIGYSHFVVEHKYAFKRLYTNSATGEVRTVHTNTIEGAWKHAKDHFRAINGTQVSNFERHLTEIMFRNWSREKEVPTFFKLIKEVFTLSQPLSLNDHGSLFPSWQRHDDAGSNDSIYPTTDYSDDDNLSNDGKLCYVQLN